MTRDGVRVQPSRPRPGLAKADTVRDRPSAWIGSEAIDASLSSTGPRGRRITYREAGARAGSPVVFLHGIGGGAALFGPQLEALGRRRHVVAWNMPGYQGSDPIVPDGIDGYARALAGFLADLALPPPILVGHSIGGMIVQRYLALDLGPVRAAVLAQTSPAFGGKDPGWAEDFVRARLEPLDRGETMASMAEATVAGMIGLDPDPGGIVLARSAVAATPEAAYRASTLAMIGFDNRDALGRIAVPVLLIAGTEDRNAPAATMARMAERIPGSRRVTVEGCGHLAMLERPQAFREALLAFLSDLEASA